MHLILFPETRYIVFTYNHPIYSPNTQVMSLHRWSVVNNNSMHFLPNPLPFSNWLMQFHFEKNLLS